MRGRGEGVRQRRRRCSPCAIFFNASRSSALILLNSSNKALGDSGHNIPTPNSKKSQPASERILRTAGAFSSFDLYIEVVSNCLASTVGGTKEASPAQQLSFIEIRFLLVAELARVRTVLAPEFLQIRLHQAYASTISLVIRPRWVRPPELFLLSIEDVAHKFRGPYYQSQQ